MSDLSAHPLAEAETLDSRWTARLDDYVIAAAWSAEEQILAAASVSGEIAFFTPDSEEPHARHRSTHAFGISSLSWHPRHPLLASSGQDGQIKIWSEGKLRGQVETRDVWIEKVAWSPDGQWLAAAAGRQIHLWELRDLGVELEPSLVSPEHANTLSDIAWRPCQHPRQGPPEVAAACYSQISFWQPNVNDPTRLLTWQGTPLALSWSPDARYLVCGEQDATLRLWALPSEQQLAMSGYPEKIRNMSWDSSSRLLASGGGIGITVWDCGGQGPEGTEPIGLEAHLDSITALAFQVDGTLLASGGREGMVMVWNPVAGQDVLFYEDYEDNEISCLSWSGRDSYLVAGTADGRLSLYTNPTV